MFHPVQQAKRWNKNIYVTPSSGGTKKKEEERMNIFCRECAHESLISIHKYIYKTTHLCLMSFAFIVFLLCRVYPKYSKIYLICCILFCWYFRCASCCAPLLVSLSLSLLVAFITVHGSEPVDSSVYQHETTIATITTQNNRFDRSKAEARCWWAEKNHP